VAAGGSKQAAVASKKRSRTVLRAANRSNPTMAGSRARGQRSVYITSSAVLICITTDRLCSSPLVQSLPMRRTAMNSDGKNISDVRHKAQGRERSPNRRRYQTSPRQTTAFN